MNSELDMTNTWLAVLAVVSVIQLLALTAMGIVGFRLYRKATTLIEGVEAKHIAPLAARAKQILEKVSDVTDHVKRADDRIRDAMHTVSSSVSRAKGAIEEKALPAIALAQGVRAAFSALRAPRAGRDHDRIRQTIDEERFAYEGGNDA